MKKRKAKLVLSHIYPILGLEYKRTRKMGRNLTGAARKKLKVESLPGRLYEIYSNAKSNSLKAGRPCTITLAGLANLWVAQEGRCVYTGWPMTTATNDPKLVSIERKDSAVGYTPDNTILVCWAANRAKSNMTYEAFVDLAAAIYFKASGVPLHCPTLLALDDTAAHTTEGEPGVDET